MSLIQLFQAIESGETIQIPSGWLQGRTIFGGLAAGILMHKAVHTIADSTKQLLSTSVTFVGPVQEGEAKVTAEILRQGKSVTTIEVRLWQEQAVQSILVASFGTLRDSKIIHQDLPQAPAYLPVSQLHALPKTAPIPQCMQQFNLVWAEGNYPCTSSKKPDFGGWFRFDPDLHENRPMTISDLMIIFDVWPPGVLPMFSTFQPASSLSWHVTYIKPLAHDLHDWFKYKVVTQHSEHGYATEYAYLWDKNDQLIAIARQTITVFA